MINTIETLAQHPSLVENFKMLIKRELPDFMHRADPYGWRDLFDRFADWQFFILSNGKPLGAALTLPLSWSGSSQELPGSFEEVLIRAVGSRELGKPVNALVSIAVGLSESAPASDSRGLVLNAIERMAFERGITHLLAPVRPAQKCHHPLTPLDQYINWKQVDGSPFDDDLRLHWKAGGVMMGTMTRAVTLEETVGVWELWAQMPFTESGEYIVAGALNPVLIDCENDRGWYEEACVWMLHTPFGQTSSSILSEAAQTPCIVV